MATTVIYPNAYTYDSYGRPHTDVEIFGPTSSRRLWALIDTGADELTVDDALAQAIGLDLTTMRTKRIGTASGGTLISYCYVDVEFFGIQMNTICYFGNPAMPLLGRVPLLSAVEVGFNSADWLST